MPEGPPIQAKNITAEMKADSLRLVYEGCNRKYAAVQVGSTGTQFARLMNPMGVHYDPDLTAEYTKAITSEAHERNRLERIRDLVWQEAEAGNSKMIEKLALIYDPDWASLRHQNLNVNVQMVARMLPHIPTAELERALAEIEREKADTIDGTVRELPERVEAA